MGDAENTTDLEREHTLKALDTINQDVILLFLLIIIEGSKTGKTTFRITDFFKGNLWDIPVVKYEMTDTNDHIDASGFVLNKVLSIFDDLGIGKIVSIGLDDIDTTIRDVLIVASKSNLQQGTYFTEIMKQVCRFDYLRDEAIKAEKNPRLRNKLIDNHGVVLYREKGIFDLGSISNVIFHAPSRVSITVTHEAEMITFIEDSIKRFLELFVADECLERLAPYQEKRLHFTQQLENFHQYVSKLAFIGDTVNIPFSILSEQDFEAVKILRYLETIRSINIRWADESSWRVQFAKIPITPNSLLGQEACVTHPIGTNLETKGSSESVTTNLQPDAANQTDAILFRLLKSGQEIIIHDRVEDYKYPLANPQYNSPADKLTRYGIAKKPDQNFTIADVEKYFNDEPFTGIPNKLLGDLGFQGILRKVFVSASKKGGICFHTVITPMNMLGANIDEFEIRTALKKLKNKSPKQTEAVRTSPK